MMISEISNLKDILIDLGYTPKEVYNGFRCANIWRGGDNPNALMIYKNGYFHDFVTNRRGRLNDLIGLTLGTKDINEIEKWANNHEYSILKTKKIDIPPSLKVKKYLNTDFLNKLINNHDFYTSRGISMETLLSFRGGTCKFGSQKNRYLFPIFDTKNNLIGLCGRDLTNTSEIKWKITGVKKEFIYPTFLNDAIIKEKQEVILVESIGDCLALWQAGIKNVIVLFGTFLSPKILTYILNNNINKIIVATNNDGHAGNEGAIKIRNKLTKFIDWHKVKIALPIKKDFGEQTVEENADWYNAI